MRTPLPGRSCGSRHVRRAAALAASAAVAASAIVSLAAPDPALAVPAASATAVISPAAGPARPVLLLNGDRAASVPGPGGRAATTLLAAPGAGPVITLGAGQHTLYVPAAALPYLGHGLDPGLFDPARLRRNRAGGRLRVQVTFTGSRPSLPGITLTRSRNGRATGYLTAASARAFIAALRRQYRADRHRASYGQDGMFAGGITVSLPGGPAPAPLRPDVPLHRVTVTGTSLSGKPDTGDVVDIARVDDGGSRGAPFFMTESFSHGTARFTVPAGHYWAVGSFFSASGNAIRIVVLPQFTVRGQTRIHLAERAASSKVVIATPRPAAPFGGPSLDVTRTGPHGTHLGVTSFGFPSTWVNPTTRKPSVGSLLSDTTATLTSPARAAKAPYMYNLAFAGRPGIIPGQHWVATPASLAAVTEHIYQDVSSAGTTYEGVFPPPRFATAWFVGQPMVVPGTETQYTSERPGVSSASGYSQFPSLAGPFNQVGSVQMLRPGQKLTENWNKYPLHPQPSVQLLHGKAASQVPQCPSAYRAGDKLRLSVTPFSDNTPGHTGEGFGPAGPGVKVTGSYAVSQNGTRVAHGSPAKGIPAVTLRHKSAVIRLQLSATRRGNSRALSPASQTAWTWRSAARQGAKLPPGWHCKATGTGGAIQPMMTLGYDVHGMSLHGATAPGRQVIGLTVGHIQDGGHAAITQATARVSADGGKSWRPAAVTLAGGGHFRISFTAPARSKVTLRVSAADNSGGSITETIKDAYQIAG